MNSRRDFLKSSAVVSAMASMPLSMRWSIARAVGLAPNLSDPAFQMTFAGFENLVPDALHPSFKYNTAGGNVTVGISAGVQQTGLVDGSINPLSTAVFGYGDTGPTWPGKTFEVQSGIPLTVTWNNNIMGSHPISANAGGPPLDPVDTSLHWCYSLMGYEGYSIGANGVPIITHLHGGHTQSEFDGNPEQFYAPGNGVEGPRYPGTNDFIYDNDQPAGNLWYHDHALGITRLNVYAGLAGFYFVRDALDTGLANNPLGLPAWPYEKAYAIQDRMFLDDGTLFYPAYPNDPFYADFIATPLPAAQFPGGGPTALAEFFGDHMVVNGVIWPKEEVEPRNYRLHLLNGTDSRFMGVRLRVAATPTSKDFTGASAPIPFWVIGSDQGLAKRAAQVDTLLIGPGERYDIVVDFSLVPPGSRVIMENVGGDAPFGGQLFPDLTPAQVLAAEAAGDFFPDRRTDRVMAFDVVKPLDTAVPDAFDPRAIKVYKKTGGKVDRIRRVALFEGMDEYGRLQPLLGTATPEADTTGTLVNGAIPWHSPTTENPGVGDTEIWEIYNSTPDGHPVHLHLVHFDILNREAFTATPVPQPFTQHNGATGQGFALQNIALSGIEREPDPVERAPKDMVTALPGEVTRIKATFDRPGRYVWHCHILSHEDHEMMRVLHVGPGA